ncbi:glycoprotein A33 (transmembrane), paralog a [Salminus brasiliensis]|uniref:glycoprotein A33 (transmembrane), paralog a n=1 Tax=Salminus brasiliensis TaxID=930266 RepID=UPI003B838603
MMAKETFVIFLLASVAVHLTLALNVDIPAPSYEFERGSNATIPCKFTPQKPDNDMVTIEWFAHPDVATDTDSKIDVDAAYEGKASLQYDLPKGIVNLQLSSLSQAESRVFACKVKIPGDNKGKQADTTQVSVLMAPSKPICKIQGKAEYEQNINLTCYSEQGTPTPTYQWASFDVRNVSRPYPPKATVVNGVLSLYNISSDTSGYFICTSSNKRGTQTCNLTLAVMPPSNSIASTAGIIGACVAGLIFLLVIIICCCRNRKKKDSGDYDMGTRQDDGYTDKEPHEIEERQGGRVESKPEENANRDQYEDRSERDYDHRSDRYPDRRDDNDDRRPRSDDRRNDRYDDRRSDRYDDRYDDRRNDRYDDRQSDRYDDRRSDRYDDRQSDRYDDRRDDRRNERRDYYDDRRDRYDDRDRPPVKPSRG